MQGIDLPRSERSEKDRQVYSEEDHEANVLWSLRTAEMKLIVANVFARFSNKGNGLEGSCFA